MNWWHYLLLVNIYLTLFYGFYVLLLRRETFFQLNRVYLVGAAVLSFVIPLIQSQWVQGLFITQQVQYAVYNSNGITITDFEPIKDKPYTLGQLFVVLYITGAAVLALKLVWQLVLLKRIINKPGPQAAYSFFKKIKLGDEVTGRDVIISHEQVHARQWHSADILIIEAVMIINWFNPVVYLYRFAIKHIHEFIADRQALAAGTDKAEYALLLLSQTFNTPAHQLVNPFFNHSLLKQRIMMLQKNKSQRIKLIKYGLSAPLFILMLILSSATISNSKAIKTINHKAEQVFLKPATITTLNEAVATDVPVTYIPENEALLTIADTVPAKGKVYMAVKQLPQFPGGKDAFSQFLSKNVKYPQQARENNVQGRVVASFIVEKDGSLSDIKILRSVGSGLDEEAVRVLKASPNWKPGMEKGKAVRTQFSVPINFALSADDNKNNNTGANKNSNADTSRPIFTAVEQSPTFPGGDAAFDKYLAANIKYPAKARQNKTEGRVIITFVVESDGTLTDLKLLRSLGDGTDEEALRVLQASPKWKPGVQNGRPVDVQYTVPINFSLAGSKPAAKAMGSLPAEKVTPTGKTTDIIVGTDKSTFTKTPTSPSPLVIIDDKESTYAALGLVSPGDISTISVLKEKTAIDKYGDKGKNGVIIVETKRAIKY
jgi:TonB family protein